jgi:DUF1680 family protein
VADVVPVAPTAGALRPLGLAEVRLDGGFWGERRRLNSEVILDHCHDWMRRIGWIANFAGTGPRQGREFSDSEVYKLMEALAWDGGREAALAELTGLVAAAQEPDGYLNTRWSRDRYTDLPWGHELYCYGHLIQAGVARLRTAGEDDRLVEVVRAAADHVCREFGPGGREAVCGHPEIEMALVELYRATGAERYLEQARLFVERRGHGLLGDIPLGRAYFQDEAPVRAAAAFRGHAVRALYLASGAVDVAVETGDTELLERIEAQWRHTVATRTYLTGGMGARHDGEAFGADWELPPDRAYAESCAGVASVQLCWRLLLATGDPAYADLAERTLYNVVATAIAADGRGFFYSNPLQERVAGADPDPGVPDPRSDGARRAPWRTVSCCPTNLARTLAVLPGYVATTAGGAGKSGMVADGLQLHQLVPATVTTRLPDGRTAAVRVTTAYPWSGEVTATVLDAGRWELSLRVPPWADGATLRVGDEVTPVTPGYASVERDWHPGDEVRLDLPVTPRWTRPDPRLDAARGCVAAERGPLVYCAESLGDRDLDAIAVMAGDLTGDPRTLSTPAAELAADGGYHPAAPLDLIPYHSWGNRTPSTMRVWLPHTR